MDLVEVQFANARVVFVQPGTTLLAAARLAGVDWPTGCTRGMCGTDAARVEAAEGALDDAAVVESSTLQRMGLPSGCRLLCSATVRRGRVMVLGDAIAD